MKGWKIAQTDTRKQAGEMYFDGGGDGNKKNFSLANIVKLWKDFRAFF